VFSHLPKQSLFWVFDMDSVRKKAITVGTILAVDVVCLVVFAGILGWI
jgi:hypothetical protein